MTYDYDRLYGKTPEALGDQTPAIAAVLDGLGRPALRILDIGCGQGRDALPLARRGHRVTGVDLSPNGIRDMTTAAAREGLAVEGIVADIVTWRPEGCFDLLLIDRTLHMLARPARAAVLARLIAHVACGGRILIADKPANMAGPEAVLAADRRPWSTTRRAPGLLIAREGAAPALTPPST